jgi:hypothetical protein
MPTTGEITIRMWDVRLIVRKKGGKKAARRRRKWGPRLKIKKTEEKKGWPRVDRLLLVLIGRAEIRRKEDKKKVKPYE